MAVLYGRVRTLHLSFQCAFADIYDAFVKKTVELAQKRTVGDPFTGKFDQGPQVCLIPTCHTRPAGIPASFLRCWG